MCVFVQSKGIIKYMKYGGPHIGFHPQYFCLGYLIAGPGKNIKNVSEQIALTGTPPAPSLVNIKFKLKTPNADS